MRILLVEDDELLGEGTRKGLSQDGYTVDWVKDGTLADQALKTEKFDLVVLDLVFPKFPASLCCKIYVNAVTPLLF